MTRPLRLDDLADLQLPSAPTLSPDGRSVVYVVRTTDPEADRDMHALRAVRDEGGGWGEPFALTHDRDDTAPAFSPGGDRVAFLRGNPAPQLHLLPLSGGEAQRLTNLPAGAGTPVWSPAGDRIAFVAPVRIDGSEPDLHAPIEVARLGYKSDDAGLHGPVRTHLHVLDLTTLEVRRLTDGDWDARSPAWSPDGARLAFTAAMNEDADRTLRSSPFVLDPSGDAAPRRIGPGVGVAGAVTWSADSAALLVAGQTRPRIGHTALLRMTVDDPSDEGIDLIGRLDRNVMPGGPGYPGGRPQLAPDGRQVVFCIRDRGCSHVYAAPVDGSAAPRPLIDDPQVSVSGLSVARDVDLAAVVLADPSTYGEIAIVPVSGGDPVRLTKHTAAGLPDVRLLRPESRTFRVHDGTQMHGWVLRDPEATVPGPLLLDAHGGPHNAWSPAPDPAHAYHQVLASRGWTVLTLNPRGSDGYGEEFWRGAAFAWGTADERDLLDPLDELVDEGIADPDRLALTGYSYGGYLTCWLTGRTDRFAAAVAGGVVADLTSLWGTSDESPALGAQEWPDPFTEPDELTAISPWSHVADVRTPTLLLHGLADQTCPPGQAELWFAALRTRGVPTQMVLYPGSSHVFILDGRPSHRIDYNRRLIDWTEHHMSTRTTTPARLDQHHWERRLDQLAARHQVVGASLAIRRVSESGDVTDDELLQAATGVLSKTTMYPATTDSVFQIGSISKVWTTTLLMQLIDEGQLTLDTPVVELLPDLRLGSEEVTQKITVRHLLTHTSGIDGDVFTDTGRGDDCLEKYVAGLHDVAQNHPLGATFSYCNSGFVLAGRVIEVLTGKTWDQVLRERIIEPLGLTHTSTLPEEAILQRVAIGHISPDPEGDPQVVPTFLMPRSVGPAGLITATAADVTSFARMHLRDGLAPDGTRVLSAQSTTAMQSHQVDVPEKYTLGDSWGVGWIRFEWDGERLYGHDGSTYGQNAYLKVLPSQGLAVALLTNGGHTTDLYNDLFDEIFREVADVAMAPQLTPPADTPDVDLSPYVGTYERSSVTSEVTERDGNLVIKVIPTGTVAEASGATVEHLVLQPVEQGLFVTQPPGQQSWLPVYFYNLPDGSPYLHYGARAQPRRS
ncbi:serine hydrolase [Allobranchiibius huperziae]|uniref:Dipeptidyl aminopeptidase/acylaminoacyl peptidase n=1 Tax=Allobranchiibius huperziae TaxID=1874116 RepID=A0A853DE23_9MICO|nr:serine hydrolase [Allobranchiibius huperziae]NYJ74907.1 dipeptidyl aminopeptidase/acylaminoacyl peptidase [Allobranchiibius huperziae]